MPHTFVIIGIIILAAVVLTWIIPAGEYVRFENAEGIKVIDPTQFSYVDRTPVNPFLIPLFIVKAFIGKIDLMLVILFCRRSVPYGNRDRRSSRNSCKACEEIFREVIYFHTDPDSCICPYLYDTGGEPVHSLCADYGNAGNGHGA